MAENNIFAENLRKKYTQTLSSSHEKTTYDACAVLVRPAFCPRGDH